MLPMGSQVIVRADASVNIGSGHVMRSISLADGLKSIGFEVIFVCKKLEGNLSEFIEKRGYKCVLIQGEDSRGVQGTELVLNENEQLEDAGYFIDILKNMAKPKWIVVDHYGFDETWHSSVSPYADRLLVIDDLANRNYYCDMLLDQTFNRVKKDYQLRVPSKTIILCGSKFALIRPEFKRIRPKALQKRFIENISIKRVLVAMGGSDPQNITETILSAIEKSKLKELLEIDVIISAQAKHLTRLKGYLSNSAINVCLHVDCNNVSELMLKADFAIGAGGGTTWERCTLGLPTLMFSTAQNQDLVIKNLALEQVVENMGAAGNFDADSLINVLRNIMDNPALLRGMSKKAFNVCDGQGVQEVTKHMAELFNVVDSSVINLDVVKKEDCEVIFGWQQQPEIRRFSRTPSSPSWKEHEAWFNDKLKQEQCYMYKLLCGDNSVGFVRLDPIKDNVFEVSILIDSKEHGKGYGLVALRLLRLYHPDVGIRAYVLSENISSQRLFASAGYEQCSGNHFLSRAIVH